MSIERLHEIWPEWTVQEQIGEGSFGRVYRAVHVEQGVSAFAAIKVISIPQTKSEIDSLRSEGIDENGTRTYFEGIVNDFVNEIKLMHSLKGIQNIVGVEDFRVVEKIGEIGWDIFIRMELLTPFNTYVSDKKLSEADVIKLGIDICTALEICGKRNIIHRDIKPENIFVNDYGFYKLGDFGIARKMENMTGGLSQKGTFNYMAPEVANSTNYDSRVDIYSLGIVLYRLLNNNRLPFLDSDKQLLNPNDRRAAVERRMNGETLPIPREASPAMGNLILRACAYDPDQRFATASDMKKALEAVANGSYVAIPVDVDATTAVRHAKSDLDGTTAVRRAQPEAKAKQQETFGKKKSKTPKIIAIIAAIAIVVASAAISVPKLLDGKDNNPSSQTEASENKTEKVDSSEDTVDYSKFDDEQIAAIIEEADALAKSEDYEGAVKKIQAGIATYKDSDKLSAKLDEYNTAITIQKNETLKADAITNSEKQANNSDFKGAIATLDTALKQLGDDDELVLLRSTYADKYAEAALSQVDSLMVENDYESAKSVLNEAYKVLPDNETIKAKKDEIEQYKTVPLSSIKPTNGNVEWNVGNPTNIIGSDYSKSTNFAILKTGYMDPRVHEVEYKLDKEYSTFSFSVAPYSGYDENTISWVLVYVDDVLRYTVSSITQKSGIINVSDIDISDADYLKLLVHVGKYGDIILSDALLKKNPSFVSNIDTQISSLATLTQISHSFGFEWDNDQPVDLFNNDYSTAKNYMVCYCGYLADDVSRNGEYFVNKQYSSFSLDVAPYLGFEERGGPANVKIYADDVLVYSSPTITLKTQKFNTGEIDISNTDYLKVCVDIEGYENIIISNAVLKPKN